MAARTSHRRLSPPPPGRARRRRGRLELCSSARGTCHIDSRADLVTPDSFQAFTPARSSAAAAAGTVARHDRAQLRPSPRTDAQSSAPVSATTAPTTRPAQHRFGGPSRAMTSRLCPVAKASEPIAQGVSATSASAAASERVSTREDQSPTVAPGSTSQDLRSTPAGPSKRPGDPCHLSSIPIRDIRIEFDACASWKAAVNQLTVPSVRCATATAPSRPTLASASGATPPAPSARRRNPGAGAETCPV